MNRINKIIERVQLQILNEEGKVKAKYRIGLTIFVCIILLAESLFLYYHSPRENNWLICIVYKFTGFYCPGCGSGRASYSILHGQFYQAFRYNPLMIILLPWIVLYIGIVCIQWLVEGEETISAHIPLWLGYLVVAIVVIYGILRNIDMYPFVLLAPTKVM